MDDLGVPPFQETSKCYYLCGLFRVSSCPFVRPFSLCVEFMSEDKSASSICDAHVFEYLK